MTHVYAPIVRRHSNAHCAYMCLFVVCAGSAVPTDAVSALSQQVQQLQLEQQQQLRALQLEQQRQLHEINRLKHTVTTAADVGARLLLGAVIDPTASFLPSLSAALRTNLLTSLPKGVDCALHSRNPFVSSNSSSSSSSSTAAHKALGDDDLVSELPDGHAKAEQPIQDSYTALLPHLARKLLPGDSLALEFGDDRTRQQ